MEWTCPRCGRTGLTGTYCLTCKTPIPPIFDTKTDNSISPENSTPQPTPTPSRFGNRRELNDGPDSEKFFDYENDVEIIHNSETGDRAVNKDGIVIYRINPDGTAIVRTEDGKNIQLNGKYSIEDIKSNMTVTGTDGYDYHINRGQLAKKVTNYDSQNRFYTINKGNGSAEIIDRVCGYNITYTDKEGYVAHDANGEMVYLILPNGNTFIKVKNSSQLINAMKPMNINDISSHMDVYDENGSLYSIDDGIIDHVVFYNSNGSVKGTDYYDINGVICSERENGVVYYYTKDEKTYKYRDEDGVTYLIGIGDERDANIVLLPSGNYCTYNPKTDRWERKGIYRYTDDDEYVLEEDDGSIIICNTYGSKIKKTTKDGKVYHYENNAQVHTINGKKYYSRINHIEYDEDDYNKILSTLNGINGKNITSGCSAVITNIRSFPDKGYSLNSIDKLETNFQKNIKSVKSLIEMTNYSLLGYQTCDEELRNGLYMLIDSLFGERDAMIANKFKESIKNTIEDRDGDNILEYKKDTNYNILAENAIVREIVIDEQGNKWYVSKNKNVIGVDGKNIKINFGGETFNAEYDENGLLILKDSNGNPLNIFADYNIESTQYGGNQEDLRLSCNDENVYDLLSKYFPNSTMEEKQALLDRATKTGCGYVAITNFIFKDFEGRESDFYDTFGYPMYSIKCNKIRLDEEPIFTVDYNYEPITMDLYCELNSKSGTQDIEYTTQNGGGVSEDKMNYMIKYVKDKYNVSFDEDSGLKYYADWGYTLYNLDGSVNHIGDFGHAMTGVGGQIDGKEVVSSWGRKLLYEASNNKKDGIYGTTLSSQN